MLLTGPTIRSPWRSSLLRPNPNPSARGVGGRRRSSRLAVRAGHGGSGDGKKSTVTAATATDTATATATTGEVPRARSAASPTQAEVRVVLTVKNKSKEGLFDKLQDGWEYYVTGIGKGISLQLVSNDIDPVTNSGKRSEEVAVRGWLPKSSSHPSVVEYATTFTVDSDFGHPGAIVVTNRHAREFHLMDIAVHGLSDAPVFFHANTWIPSRSDSTQNRILFSNQPYLPSQTPEGLKELRRNALIRRRGDGKGERKKFEMVYDYDVYNDLGEPDKDADLARPVLGGKERPYPRRCRTGRPPTKSDPNSESRVPTTVSIYVPRDENFEEIKQSTFSLTLLKSVLHSLVPGLKAIVASPHGQFECFSDIDKLYKDGVSLKGGEELLTDSSGVFSLLNRLITAGERLLKYEVPSAISKDRFSWLRDNEFARQTLAGVNPSSIERLREFPILSKLDPSVYGPPESAITKEVLERELAEISVEQAMENQRLFILDYHDILLPYVEKINSLEARKTYASRTIFFLTDAGILRPVVIELSLPPTTSGATRKRIYTRGHDATSTWIWKFAKAHVCSSDAGLHQLVNHWLRTHCCMEPYIIATNRQLSSMHPIFKLLLPHMRYTMEINGLARQSLINAEGIIEECFSPGKFALEMSSAAYKSLWRFDMEALPADLIRRGMAVEDPTRPYGLKLVIEDYPYAEDGLLVWSATEEWVRDYVNHFYPDDASVRADVEVQAWWDEIKNEGHRDKKDEPWWPALASREDLVRIVTTMIWTASGMHAAINFGQYPFGGYMPNRPTLMRKLIPLEDEREYEEFLRDPQYTFLAAMPSQLQVLQVRAVQNTLSAHSPDEEYLGQTQEQHANWIRDPEVTRMLDKFSARLEEVEKIIRKRNGDYNRKNRSGAGVPAYELLLRSSGPGVTGRGIPNSISI